MRALIKGATPAKSSNATAVRFLYDCTMRLIQAYMLQILSGSPQKTYDIKLKHFENTKYYELPESAIPRGWFSDPEQLQEVPDAGYLGFYGFKVDKEQPIAVIMRNDGSDLLLFEFKGCCYLWNPIASVLRHVSGAQNINGVLDELHKGHGIVGPEIPCKERG